MHQFTPFSLNIKGRLINCNRPQIMGIINVTPDSFYSSSRTEQRDEIKVRVEEMLASGVDMIDLGGYSSRTGAPEVSPSEELSRLERGMEAVRAVSYTHLSRLNQQRYQKYQSETTPYSCRFRKKSFPI